MALASPVCVDFVLQLLTPLHVISKVLLSPLKVENHSVCLVFQDLSTNDCVILGPNLLPHVLVFSLQSIVALSEHLDLLSCHSFVVLALD